MANPRVNRANRYARDVVAGKIDACRFVRLACQRHLDDLARERDKSFPYRFDRKTAEQYCRLVEQFPHVKGKWAGQPFLLQPWQLFILCCVFGWKRKSDGLRRFREMYVEVPRKNGKSALAAAIGLLMAFVDGESGAEVYSGATSEKQAWEVFRPARLMAEQADGFKEDIPVDIRAKAMFCHRTASKFEPLIGKPGDGASPHCAIIDEYHEHQTPDLYDTMKTGMGARTQPLQVVITTAGTNISGPCYDRRGHVVQVLEGLSEDDTLFGIIFTLDEDDDWTDLDNWRKANPNFGVSVFEDFLADRLREAKSQASRQNIIRCKHLNQWLNANTAWMNMVAWNKCADRSLAMDDFSGRPCWIGLDLANKVDITAMVILFRDGDTYTAFGRYYLAEETVWLPENTHYQSWAQEELIVVTPGAVTDFEFIKDDLRSMAEKFDIQEVAYDPWQAAQLASEMDQEGLPMVEMRQTVLNMSEPMKQLEASVLSGDFRFTGDPVLTWMASNVTAHFDAKDNIYPRKDRREAKIDGIVALIMAMGRAMLNQGPERSIYEERGVLFL